MRKEPGGDAEEGDLSRRDSEYTRTKENQGDIHFESLGPRGEEAIKEATRIRHPEGSGESHDRNLNRCLKKRGLRKAIQPCTVGGLGLRPRLKNPKKGADKNL